jgi:CRISPR/Cas system CSM-associated protein Csm3 (group 7 of RAMP superfamily)
VASPHNTYATLAEFGQRPTLLSRIFGSSLYPGTIRFDDAKLQRNLQQERYKKMQTSVSTQVRIDRATRIAVDEALYTSEFGMRDLIFEGTIKGQLDCTMIPLLSSSPITDAASNQETDACTPTYSLLLLLAGILLIERLGGNKSTGKGQCSCRVHNLLIDKQLCSEDQWQSWIEHLDVLSDYLINEKGA